MHLFLFPGRVVFAGCSTLLVGGRPVVAWRSPARAVAVRVALLPWCRAAGVQLPWSLNRELVVEEVPVEKFTSYKQHECLTLPGQKAVLKLRHWACFLEAMGQGEGVTSGSTCSSSRCFIG